MSGIQPKTDAYPWPWLLVDHDLMEAIVAKQKATGWTYKLGDKIPLEWTSVPPHEKTDCSGEVRYLLWRCAGVDITDGSPNQHAFIKSHGFKLSDVEAGKLHDGKVRIAFLSPAMTTSHIGHVLLIRNGKTFESHGSVGPDSRDWTGLGWQGHCQLYVLDPRGN